MAAMLATKGKKCWNGFEDVLGEHVGISSIETYRLDVRVDACHMYSYMMSSMSVICGACGWVI